MFVYLSKKIAIPNNIKLNCIDWNNQTGYIAVAGCNGLLKVLKLENAPNSQNKGALAALSNLSMNQTLEGHKDAVRVVVWNDKHQKLTSSDVDGVIMVWMLYKGIWYEEMTNDRKKSTVNGMSWTPDGSKICIVYEDGAIIVGSVDGNRIWSKELKNTHLSGVQWSPDGMLLLFSLANGECHLYDNQGIFAMKLDIQCVHLRQSHVYAVAAICWHSGRRPAKSPTLAICYANSKVQLMRGENDNAAIILDTNMNNVAACWNHNGNVLAICGSLLELTSNKDSNQVNFYSPYGQLLRSLRVPGSAMTSMSWEGKSLRIAMAVDSFIYFANVRPEYIWCYFQKTVVFLNSSSSTNNNNNQTSTRDFGHNMLTFWNTVTNHSFLKEVEPPICMAACKEYCVIAVTCLPNHFNEMTEKETANKTDENNEKYRFQLLLCNSIGTTVDSKYINIEPNFIDINSNSVVIASHDEIMLWQYHTPKSTTNLHGTKARKEQRYHVDDTPTGIEMAHDLIITAGEQQRINSDAICAIAMSEKLLLIARISGAINEYTLPKVALCNCHNTNIRAYKMAINSNSTRLAIIDQMGVMSLLELDDERNTQLNFSRVERKDVWDVCWASDNPLLLALMEKTRMYIFRGNDPEEPISCAGYLCCFEELEITSVLLDDIINCEETQNPITHIIQLRAKSLRDTDDLLQHVGLEDAKQFIEDNPHPRLWRLLAESALKKLQLDMAENAFVRCANYPGIQFIKRLRNITSGKLQRAEVAAYYGEYEEAEKLYMDADRRDLAIDLRITLCDWFRVVQLYRMGSGISDQQMETAWREIGNHFAHLCSWESAKEYFEKAHHVEGLMEAYYNLEQFEELESCIQKLPEKNPLLAKLAQMLASVGMCSEAVEAYLKLGDDKAAVDTCVNLRQWGQAVELAKKFDMPQVSQLLNKQAGQLLKEERISEAIELQKKAGHYLEAARLLQRLAEQETEKHAHTLRIKKLYVLAGLLTEQHLTGVAKNLDSTYGNHIDRNTLLDSLAAEDAATIERIWHCAEAHHFLLLAQKQLRFGIMRSAVMTSLRLRDYEDVLNVEDIYCLLTLSSCADRYYGTCSKGFMKLEDLEGIPEKRQNEYKELAVSIFSKHEPIDAKAEMLPCTACNEPVSDILPSCNKCGMRFPVCISSGAPIRQPTTNIWICGACNHCALPSEIARHRTCPLCHTLIVALTLEI